MVSHKNTLFGQYVYKKRTNLGLTLQNIADAVGVTKTYIYDIEKGNNKPPLDYKKLDEWSTVLSLKRKSRELLFDYASEGREVVPTDIAKAILEDEKIKKVIRRVINDDLSSDFWDTVLANTTHKTKEDESDEE